MAEKQENLGTVVDQVNENVDNSWNLLVLARVYLFSGSNEKEDDSELHFRRSPQEKTPTFS